MERKIIVFHHDHFLSQAHSCLAEKSMDTTRKAHIERQHDHLHKLAGAIISSAGGDAKKITASLGKASAHPGKKHQDKYEAFESLGAIVMDHELFDADMLHEVEGVSVIANARISSIQAAPGSAGDVPDFWHLQKINISALRDKGLTGKGTVIGLLDSGIDISHKEFAGKKVWYARFDKEGKFVDSDPIDFGTHGTHVSGLLAGKNAGVAPEASLAVAAVLTEYAGEAGYLAQILGGLNWLLTTNFSGDDSKPGVHLVNASLEVAGHFNDFLYHTLKVASSKPGTLLVGAIGDKGTLGEDSDASPGNYDIVLGVGSTNKDDKIPNFSAWGAVAEEHDINKPDLVAPGVDIWSSIPGPGDQYEAKGGTSMSSPIVCGVAALLIQENSALTSDPVALKAEITKFTKPLPLLKTRAGKGRLELD